MRKLPGIAASAVLITAACVPAAHEVDAPTVTDDQLAEVALRMPAAIDHADWDEFVGLFTEDAVMTFPFRRERANSQEEITRFMRPIFARNAERLPGPIFGFEPRDVQVRRLGRDGAVVSWVMDHPLGESRRTAVLRRESSGWKIALVHADTYRLEPDSI